ncbi:MAG: outer membrane beta-barrel protein [Alphaproteobacteria bacterium]|nr:outer membrane beta-barrel protein [Alphaproteobacteria bacterium]
MKRILGDTASLAVLAAALMGPCFTAAQAADLAAAPVVYTKAPLAVDDWSPWAIRVRAADVFSSSKGKSTLFNQGAPMLDSPTSSLAMSSAVIPVIDVAYFFTRNLAVELDFGYPPRSTISGTGALDGLTIGKASALAPVLMFQYHFTELGRFQPYAGVGINYTTFFDVKAGNSPTVLPATSPAAASVTSLRIKDSVGAVAQLGFDYMIDRHWGINIDAKKVWMRPDYSATADILAGGTVLQHQLISGSAHIDPWILGGGVTYRF